MSVEKHFVMKQVSIFQCGADPKYTTIGSGSKIRAQNFANYRIRILPIPKKAD